MPMQRRQARWEAAIVFGAMLGVVAVGLVGQLVTSTRSVSDEFRRHLIGLAQGAATLVDPVLHNEIRRPDQQNGPDYVRAVAPLRRFHDAVRDIHYIYTLVLDRGRVHFVLDAADPGARGAGAILEQSAVWAVYDHRDLAMLKTLGAGGARGVPSATEEPLSDEWGTFMTGYAPLIDSQGRQIGAIGVDVDATLYVARLAAARHRALWGFLPTLVLMATLGVVFYRVRLRGLYDASAAMANAQTAKQTEAHLAQERERLAAVIEGTQVGTWAWRADDAVLSMSDRCYTMLGYYPTTLGPLTMPKWRSLVHPLDLKGFDEAVRAASHSVDRLFVSEFRIKCSRPGWLWVLARGRVMQTDGAGLPTRIVGIIMDVSSRKAMESALMRAAQQDPLTGLPNRAVFMERVEQILTRRSRAAVPPFAVLFLDFDHFKLINDTLGHKAGDELLRQIGVRLESALLDDEAKPLLHGAPLVSRFGGDEFLILIRGVDGAEHAMAIAQKVLQALRPVYNVFGSEVHSIASVGIVTSEQCSTGAEEIVRNADVAMYEAKRAGRGRAVVFNDSMHARLTRHVAIESSLRRAIERDELYLEYQPVVDLHTGERVYVEALVRWRHPVLGLVSPDEFIPLAEESGLIVAVGQWVLRTACQTMAGWRRQDPVRAPERISVNISRPELALGGGLVEEIETTLRATGVPAECLQLEVTERDVMRSPDAARDVLRRLRALGIKLAMDDFGTGHSSLAVLRTYPFDTIKIDRSFLQDLHSSREVLAVIHATIHLIQNLSMISLAEGLEDATQVAILQSLGCEHAQGFFFSRPLPAHQVLQAVGRRTGDEGEGEGEGDRAIAV